METLRNEAHPKTAFFIAVALTAAIAGSAYVGHRLRARSTQFVAAHIMTWRDSPRLLAELLIERYGPPDKLAPGTATWSNKGGWKRITVHGVPSQTNYLEQTVGYRVPPEAAGPLMTFGNGLSFDLDTNELSASSNRESLNYLAVNLAEEIIAKKRSPEDARDAYARLAVLAAAGKSSPYLNGFLFQPHRGAPPERVPDLTGY